MQGGSLGGLHQGERLQWCLGIDTGTELDVGEHSVGNRGRHVRCLGKRVVQQRTEEWGR